MTDINDTLCVERPGDPRHEQRVEYAAIPGGGSSPFPESWGFPEGRPGSDERRQWIFRHAGGTEQRLRQLRERDRALKVVLDRALLEQHKGDAND
jgi:hypothetical protein